MTACDGSPTPTGSPNSSATSCAPLWAAVTADRDSYQGHRTGNINPLLYFWQLTNPSKYFTDITGQGPLQRAATNNGLFPTTPGYDEATGIGTPKFAGIITG